MYSCTNIVLLVLAIESCVSEKSFTIVLDTTNSMKEEINIIRANIEHVVNSVNTNDYDNFVLVSFKDTVVEPAFTTQSARALMTHLNSLTTSGGNECPENSLAGIEAALRASEKQSIIFVFTDAYANDFDKFRSVEDLCKESHSQVMIFLSGYCESTPSSQAGSGWLDVYFKLAKSCSGAVLRFDPIFHLRQVFGYMKEVANVQWTNVSSYEPFANFNTFSFTVDTFTTDFMILATGENPSIELMLNFGSKSIQSDNVLQTRYATVVSLPHTAAIGEYTASIRGQGMVFVTLYQRIFIPFEFGFSTKTPRNMKETSPQPLAGFQNYVLIVVDKSINLRSIEWLVLEDSAKQILPLQQTSPGSYIANVYILPGKMFRFWIVGEDTETLLGLKGASKLISPQRSVKNVIKLAPEAEILDLDLGLIEYGVALTLACKVAAHPKPTIQWKDENDNYLTSEDALLEIPYIYISYATISKVSKNSTVTCYCENDEGTTSKSIEIFVNRTYSFDVIQSPEDVTVEYESEQHLYCEVDAYPEASISWYLNDSLVNAYTNPRITLEDNALVIKKMGFEDVGVYECRASNEVETKKLSASVQLSGIETPEIKYTNTENTLKLGYSAELECRIKTGKPIPKIDWKYRTFNDYEFSDLPYGVSKNDAKLQITSVEKRHVGVYKCVASNIMGEDSLEFTVNIKYAPVIKDKDKETLLVKKDDEVRLSCEVEAMPEATVRWELVRGYAVIPFNQRHRTDEKHNHYFLADSSDAGEYRCIAENDVGRAERIVTIQVQELPYIGNPGSSTIEASIGSNMDLTCNVLSGFPTPSIRWQFKAKDSSLITLSGSQSTFHLSKLTRNDEGTYLCIAENTLGYDLIKYHIKIQ